MSIFLIKMRRIVSEILGIDLPILEQMAYKGAIGAIATNLFEQFLRKIYISLNLAGVILLKIFAPYEKEKQPLPPIGNRKLLRDSAATIAQKVRLREVSAVEVVKTFIERINEVNERLNCVVDHRFDDALKDAERMDEIAAAFGPEELRLKYPLLGVPFTIKDFFSVKGLKHTTGLYYRKDVMAKKDAEIVTILRNHGAIPLGVTNVPELCMWWESVNTVYGRSKNPYDTRHITGGSSGGEASIQGAAGSGFGIGSDIGGSIRMPAFFCGVYGHKPTIGLVTNHGQEPKLEGRLRDFLTTGPIVRHPEDLELLFNIMVDKDARPKLNPVPDMSKIRIFYMEDDGGSPLSTPVSPDIKIAMRKAIKYFERKHGVKAEVANVKRLYHSLGIWAHGMVTDEKTTFCKELALHQGAVNPFWEMLKFAFRCSPHTIPALILGVIEKVLSVSRNLPWHKKMVDMGYALAQDIQDLLGDDGILLYPTHPNSAPRHHEPMFRPSDFSYCAIFNVLGVPVTQVPLGLDSSRMPIGVQIVGGMFSDLLTIRVAQEIHEAFGGWVPPCQV